jgi:hypothetical protein
VTVANQNVCKLQAGIDKNPLKTGPPQLKGSSLEPFKHTLFNVCMKFWGTVNNVEISHTPIPTNRPNCTIVEKKRSKASPDIISTEKPMISVAEIMPPITEVIRRVRR